ncbi:MAG: hypothetical protein PHS49_06900 [Candidatus Gracilibacteria bacterium]|nr:hypothetical protein [Candidatus Gracilibacteria bacterium]
MSIRNRNNKNKIKNEIDKLINNLNFKSLNLSLSRQVVLVGCAFGYLSLFIPWIVDKSIGKTWNAFHSLSGNIGYLLMFILFLPIFVIFSTNYKEKLKLYSDLTLKNHFIIITSGFFVISFSIISLSFVNGLNTFVENTSYGNGVILSLTSGLIILIGGLIIRKEYYNNSSEIILNKLNQNREEAKEKDNMKLPF